MPTDSFNPGPSSAEQVGSNIFAFNTNAERTPAPFVTPEVPEVAPVIAPEVVEPAPAVKLTLNSEASADVPVEPILPAVEIPEPSAPAPEAPVFQADEVQPEAQPEATETLPDFPSMEEVEPKEEPVEEPEVNDGELEDIGTPKPELEVLAGETTEEGPEDVDAKFEKAEQLRKEAEAMDREGLGMIDREVERIDKRLLELATEHKEALHAYQTQKETLQNTKVAMLALRKKTADKLGIKEADSEKKKEKSESGIEILAA